MRQGQPSRTALSTAFHRAAHQILDGGSIFSDPLAARILGSDAEAVVRSTPEDPCFGSGRRPRRRSRRPPKRKPRRCNSSTCVCWSRARCTVERGRIRKSRRRSRAASRRTGCAIRSRCASPEEASSRSSPATAASRRTKRCWTARCGEEPPSFATPRAQAELGAKALRCDRSIDEARRAVSATR